jgi:hypothetical protein
MYFIYMYIWNMHIFIKYDTNFVGKIYNFCTIVCVQYLRILTNTSFNQFELLDQCRLK